MVTAGSVSSVPGAGWGSVLKFSICAAVTWPIQPFTSPGVTLSDVVVLVPSRALQDRPPSCAVP